MNIGIIINILSALIQVLVGYEIGDMIANALDYTTTRGQAFKDGFIILGCIIGRLVLDRFLLKQKMKQDDSEDEEGFSPIILDVVTFTIGTILLMAFLGLFDKGCVSVTLAAMLISFVILIIKDIDFYFLQMPNIELINEDEGVFGEDIENIENVEEIEINEIKSKSEENITESSED